jgi:hypothetical protein
MDNIWWLIIGLYFVPMIFNLLFVYSDKEVTTVEDLMRSWWGYFVPLLNLLVTIAIPIYYISVYCKNDLWNKIKDIKIK